MARLANFEVFDRDGNRVEIACDSNILMDGERERDHYKFAIEKLLLNKYACRKKMPH